jgi:hypothetical protein
MPRARTQHPRNRLVDPLERPRARRPYARPSVRTGEVQEWIFLLCSTGRPYVCEGGWCCDAAPDCRGFCNGG